MQKVRESRISEHSDHNGNEHRANLENGNVAAEPVVSQAKAVVQLGSEQREHQLGAPG
jgi:hypothetical protein